MTTVKTNLRKNLSAADGLSALRRKVQPVFRRFPLATVYLFGSRARGDTGPLSDYDFALQFSPGLRPGEQFALKAELAGELSKVLKTDSIDVVCLDQATPLLAHRILKEGRMLYCRNQRLRVRNEFELLTHYLDFQEDLKFYAHATFG